MPGTHTRTRTPRVGGVGKQEEALPLVRACWWCTLRRRRDVFRVKRVHSSTGTKRATHTHRAGSFTTQTPANGSHKHRTQTHEQSVLLAGAAREDICILCVLGSVERRGWWEPDARSRRATRDVETRETADAEPSRTGRQQRAAEDAGRGRHVASLTLSHVLQSF